MPIKMIVVDLDGTFLNSKRDYDREKFARQYALLKEKGVHFVAASGNQLYRMKSIFEDIHDEMAFIAENGSFVVDQDKEIFAASLPKEDVLTITDELLNIPDLSFILCGKKSAYMLDRDFAFTFGHYNRLERVANYDEVDDQFFKFSIVCPEEDTQHIYQDLKAKVSHLIEPVISGPTSIDLGIYGVNKATGIMKLEQHWNIKPDEIMAFGDSRNDLEMLKHVKYSFAMANADDSVKEHVAYLAPSNDESGVLEVIDQFLNKEGIFSS